MRRDQAMAVTSILLGIGIAISAVLGPLWLGVIRQRITDGMESQVIGGDLISLVVAVPLAVVAGVLWWRGHRLAPVIALGPALHASYLCFQYITAPDYLRYPGSSEDCFPLFFAILLLGLIVAVEAWDVIDERHL